MFLFNHLINDCFYNLCRIQYDLRFIIDSYCNRLVSLFKSLMKCQHMLTRIHRVSAVIWMLITLFTLYMNYLFILLILHLFSNIISINL